MEQKEGVIAVQLDDILDPKESKKTGKPYYQISVKRPGVGTGDLFVTEKIYNDLKAAGVKAGAALALVFKLNKFGGTMETRLDDVVIL